MNYLLCKISEFLFTKIGAQTFWRGCSSEPAVLFVQIFLLRCSGRVQGIYKVSASADWLQLPVLVSSCQYKWL